MKDHQLRSFVLAAQEGSFTKAAQQSYITTTSFAQQITLLEKSLGFKCFFRKPSGVSLTAAGEAFYPVAVEVLRLLDEGMTKGREIQERELSTVRIGCAPEETPPFLPELCALFKESHSDIAITFVVAPYAEQLKDLAADTFDVCFMPYVGGEEETGGLVYESLYADAMCCCMAPEHRLAEKERLGWEDLAGETLFIEDTYAGIETNRRIVSFYRERADAPLIDSRPFDRSLLLELRLGKGILPVPRRYTENVCPPLVAVCLEESSDDFGAVYRRDAKEAVCRFIDFVRDYFND